MKRVAAVLVLLMISGCASSSSTAPRAMKRRVVMISIDGLKPEYYTDADRLRLKIPNLRRLMQSGLWADGVVGVLPTVTYPSHTTLITGATPRVHGIVSNYIFDPLDISNGAWTWYSEDIRVPTLIDLAEEGGAVTAAVSWPVSVGLNADWNMPEYWRAGSSHISDVKLLAALSTPGLLANVARWRQKPFPVVRDLDDHDRTDVARWVLEQQKPGLMLLHIFDLDSAQHAHGPFSAEALKAVEESDALVGEVIASMRKSGTEDDTVVAIVSDHGFLPYSRTLKPNVLLKDAGILRLDEKGKVKEWDAIFVADGGSAALRTAGSDAAVVARVAKLFEGRKEIHQILDAGRVKELGNDASLVLDAATGFSFSSSFDGEWDTAANRKGSHGFSPDRPEMRAAFIISGPLRGARTRGSLGVVQMTSIAPTIARILGGGKLSHGLAIEGIE